MFIVYRKSGVNYWPLTDKGIGSMSGGNIVKFNGESSNPDVNGGLESAALQACEFSESKGMDVKDGEILLVRNAVQEAGGIRMVRASVILPPVSKYRIEEV